MLSQLSETSTQPLERPGYFNANLLLPKFNVCIFKIHCRIPIECLISWDRRYWHWENKICMINNYMICFDMYGWNNDRPSRRKAHQLIDSHARVTRAPSSAAVVPSPARWRAQWCSAGHEYCTAAILISPDEIAGDNSNRGVRAVKWRDWERCLLWRRLLGRLWSGQAADGPASTRHPSRWASLERRPPVGKSKTTLRHNTAPACRGGRAPLTLVVPDRE